MGVALGEQWGTVHRGTAGWDLDEGRPVDAAATLALDAETAWRQLTGRAVAATGVRTTGDPELVASLLAVRSIIV